MSEPAYSQSGGGTIRSVVGKEKATALTTGSVKDSASQSLSTLSEHESAAGERKSAASTKAPRNAKAKSAGTNCPSDARASAKAESKGKARAARQAAEAKGLPAKQAEQPSKRTPSPKSAIASGAIHETDDTPEFEGVGGAYDKVAVAKRVFLSTGRAKEAKGKTARATARSAKKSRGAAGTTKAATSRTASAKGVLGVTASAGRTAQAASASAAVAERAATTKTLGAAASSALAPIAGIVAGIIAFVLGVLVVSNIVSALFGFWENEANKQAMEGLPPYITYEMVEAALECQETYGHPAGCTLAQIICESGQGDHMSQLATRDKNLFGIKWASSFAACPEVAGKSSWRTGEVCDGAHVVITAYFTVFKSDVGCIKFRSRVFLKQPHFANNPSIQQAIAACDSDKMAEGLKEGGWATSPTYVETLKSIMDTYDLRRFDSMSVADWKDMDGKAQKIIAAAESQLGVPYVWGGSTPGVALDCSGLTQYCYAQAGISIGHNTEAQASQLRHAPLSQAKPGDILYRPGHVAIYAGGDQYIHEPHSGDVCRRASGISYFSYALTYRAI